LSGIEKLSQKISMIVQKLETLKGENEALRLELIKSQGENDAKNSEIQRLIDQNAMKDLEIEEIIQKIENIMA
jgi:cell division protein ZapB